MVLGEQPITVEMGQGPKTTFPNVIAAAILSGWATYDWTGYAQLVKVIGKVRSLAESPGLPGPPASVSMLVAILQRFRECCEPYRVSRRLHFMRGWGHGKAKQVFTGSA